MNLNRNGWLLIFFGMWWALGVLTGAHYQRINEHQIWAGTCIPNYDIHAKAFVAGLIFPVYWTSETITYLSGNYDKCRSE